jgi:hypothetical protein
MEENTTAGKVTVVGRMVSNIGDWGMSQLHKKSRLLLNNGIKIAN